MNSGNRSSGFTLIEVLIVVVIVGILAAIAVPRFTVAKSKAFDATSKSDLRNAMTAQEGYYSDNLVYADDAADLAFTPSTNVVITIESGGVASFVMTAEHPQGQCWEVDSETGTIELRGDAC